MKNNMKKLPVILLILTMVVTMCGCRINTDYDIEEEFNRAMNQNQTETENLEDGSEMTLSEEPSGFSEEISAKDTSKGYSTARKALMLILGIVLPVLGIILLIVDTKLSLYARVFEFHETTRQAMAATLKKDVAGFFGSLCKLLGGISLIVGFLSMTTFLTWTGM